MFGTHAAENNDAGDHEESDDEIERQMDARALSDNLDVSRSVLHRFLLTTIPVILCTTQTDFLHRS